MKWSMHTSSPRSPNLEVYPTQVNGLVWCHRVRGWMVMCQCVGGMEGDGSMCGGMER